MRTSPRDGSTAAAATSLASSISHHLSLELGDSYEGAVEVKRGVAIPHGRGVWRSGDGRARYEGHFVQRWRDGYGRLCTPTFTLWARWRMDRPDLSSSTRVDYPNGDRYCGFVELKVKQPPSAQARSKFSAWAASVEPSRHCWGELVTFSGDRYVGEWADNEREGFGCYMWASGSRYIGRFRRGQFHDTGTLFVFPAEVEVCLSRLCSDGGWSCGSGDSKPLAERHAPCGAARWPPASRPGWDGVVLDVVWRDGKFSGEGHVTLPSGVRISADWRNASSPVDGELVLPSLTPQARMDTEVYEWRESFQWESLLSNADAEARRIAYEKADISREGIQQSNSTEYVRSCVLELLNTHKVAKTALHVFRRCFYCLYGTCGVDTEVGAGGHGNPLGWCTLRNAYGGCIHPAEGRCISAADLDLALRDIASLARSMVRWVLDMVGPEQQSKVLDYGGEALVGRWVADRVFQHCYPVLLNLYSQVYRAEETALAASVARLRDAVTLDDIGVAFARQSESQEKLFDPYTDAVHCVEKLNNEAQTLTQLLKVLVQWSREIDLSTRLTQACTDGRQKPARSTSGSADDLLPIHQYVLSQSRCRRLYAVTKLLSDFAAEPLFMESTSQEAFGVTTLQACVLTLLRLHPWERDASNILVPFSVALDGVREVVQRRAALAEWVHEACSGVSFAASTDAPTLDVVERVMSRYVALWVPRMVGWMGEHANATSDPQPVDNGEFTQEELSLVFLGPPIADGEEALCFCCWLYASALLDSVHMRLLLGPHTVPHRLSRAEDVAEACTQLRGWAAGASAAAPMQLQVKVAVSSPPAVPSRLLSLESHLTELLHEL
ncbi:conserved hypothetical protein [Leishmania major strain Friedlin]|uniref:VPS9 domain-containing protein n=2 Tax=Leishmania major TaxID=5664 RepID=Q4Q9K3_LEIMA|nr:conserved hypothetical protein [Leishmania major strain Friedlin]CAG9575258.1 MORN_repeat/Vacuolar_sorting_protein_9_(VPS9)_domain_containing_protein_-_putative [Leishmania major strain Friedlin]CAJ05619.1 conserved hypothetical protein [Leishmania major strain Friedlin]|eukprot:XP_001683995.1 conserved hypothetical protein [Leishmania major strain Friedlin]